MNVFLEGTWQKYIKHKGNKVRHVRWFDAFWENSDKGNDK